MKITPKQSLKGLFTVPGDKSISHRAVMFGALAEGTTEIEGFLMGADCLSTIRCFRQLGIDIEVSEDKVIVHGKGLHGLSAPSELLDVGNSGTTLRLLTGILAAQNFTSQISGDASIQKRPMNRVVEPLRLMGAKIAGHQDGNLCPLTIQGQPLTGINYRLPVASAQVKSALILAGLYAQGQTVLHEPSKSRNHTEIMLNYLGATIDEKGFAITCSPTKELYARKILVPGDISSAAFFLVAGLIRPDSEIIITNVGVNVTRMGIVTILKQMGADIQILNKRKLCGDWVADLLVRSAPLYSTTIGGSIIPKLIDEIPILAVAACFAQGTTIIKDAQELKVKESNRIRTMVTELKKMGAHIEETEDGMCIEGGHPLHGALVESYHDHRVAMSLAVAALGCVGETNILHPDCVDISFPNFYEYLHTL